MMMLVCGTAFAAGSCVASFVSEASNINKLTFTCTGDSADGSFPAVYYANAVKGWIFWVKTIPGATQPTADYDITLTDQDAVDVAGGALADRSASLNQSAKPTGPGWINGLLTINITNNSVNSAGITVVIYIYKEP